MTTLTHKTKYQPNDRGELDLIIAQLRQEFHHTLDLNFPMVESTLIEIDAPARPPLKSQHFENNNGVRNLMKDAKMRGLVQMEMMMNKEENTNKLDLSLRLSPPGLHHHHHQQQEVSPNQVMELSSPSSQRSCMSLDMNSIESSDIANMEDNEVPSLVLMGCTYCLIYVMVSEVDPKCPKCKSAVLIDMFRHNPAKRPRKC